MRSLAKKFVDAALRPFGARAVGRSWGPRGYLQSFARLKAQGLVPAAILDVGASDGRWTRECQTLFPSTRYALFDALPEHEPLLRAFASNDPNIVYWSGALGPEVGQVTINVHGHQSSILSSQSFPGSPLKVPMRPLDSFIDPMALRGPLLIKADVQGYEIDVLQGATNCLDMTQIILLELSFRRIYEAGPLAHDVIGWLGARGFRMYDICSYVQRERDEELLQSDVVFVRDGAVAFDNEGWN